MSENARQGISSAALRYLQLIEQNEENGDANLECMSSAMCYGREDDDDKQNESSMISFNNSFAENKQDDSQTMENSFMNLHNNPFTERHQNDQNSSFMKSFNNPFAENRQSNSDFFNNTDRNSTSSITNILEDTDILIDDSDIQLRPNTDQMPFLHQLNNQNSFLVPSTSSKSLEFDSNSSKSFSSPPTKRFCFNQKESFFSSNGEQSGNIDSFFKQPEQSESFFKPTKTNNNCTDDIFNIASFNKSYRNNISVNETSNTENVFEESVSTSNASRTMQNFESDMELTLQNEENKVDNSNVFFDQDSSKEIPTTSTVKRISKINTYYEAKHMLDTKKIDEFYKAQESIDWNSDNIDMSKIMEPSIDYLLYKLNCLKPLTTGRKEDTIVYEDEDEFNCDSITEDPSKIEDTFERGNFICSTPEPERQENEESHLEIGDLNMPISAQTYTNAPQNDDDEDNNTTKSFLVKPPTQNVWSALTHVSCSIPLNEQEISEPQFDITTVFDLSYNNNVLHGQDSKLECVEDDTARYELLLSILKDCNNPLDKTTAEEQETLKIAENRKAALMSQIEMLIEALTTSLVNENSMIIKLHRIKDWKDCQYESNVLSQKETAIKIKSLSFTNKNTERTFTIIIHLLGEIYKLLGQNITCTKRELYYRDVELMNSQVCVNKAIDEICALFNVQCWELGVLSTSKGLIAGDLRIQTDDDEIIDYSTTNSVPQKPSAIKSMQSNAEYVLVVEKDTVFTRLIEDNIMDKIEKKIILITAKGYPDINTRVLLKRIETDLQIPIYIIVDADAYGIDIMCTYKFGSLQMVKFSEQLAISTMEWIGIHPTDIEKLDITRTQLTDADVKKVDELLARPYINDHLRTELEHLKIRGLKAEIESIYHFSIDYLVHDYIPQKIAAISGPMKEIVRGSDYFSEHLIT